MRTSRSAIVLGVALSVAFHCAPADAVDVKFCVKVLVTYIDSGVGEDYYPETIVTGQALRGALAWVRRGGTTKWIGWLADSDSSASPGAGCTGEFDVGWLAAGTYSVTIYSQGIVGAFSLVVREHPSSSIVSNSTNIFIGSGGTYEVTISAGANAEQWRGYLATSYGLWRSPGNVPPGTLTVRVGDIAGNPLGNCTGTQACDDELLVDNHPTRDDTSRKFIMTHEQGHIMGRRGSGPSYGGGDCLAWNFNDCPALGSHSMVSKEVGRCGYVEGFAHFWSATVWNSLADNNCWFGYWVSSLPAAVNCETASGPYAVAYMEDKCDAAWNSSTSPTIQPPLNGTGWEGLANELDWLRTFWDMSTDDHGECTTNPSLGEIMNWMSSTTWYGANADEENLNRSEALALRALQEPQPIWGCFFQADALNRVNHYYTP